MGGAFSSLTFGDYCQSDRKKGDVNNEHMMKDEDPFKLISVESTCCTICLDDDENKMLRLSCGHRFHKDCLKTWLCGLPKRGELFLSNNARCPLCKVFIEYEDDEITEMVEPIKSKYEKTFEILKNSRDINMDLKRLDQQKKEKSLDIDFMSEYMFYLCHDCGEIFFGGLKECERDMVDEEEIDPEKEKKDRLGRLCVKCAHRKSEHKTKNFPTKCKKHGSSFIVFKCKYCCDISNWFCHGNTHYCDRCHKLYPNMKVVKCPGYPKCKGAHIENGKEQCFGCLICRNEG